MACDLPLLLKLEDQEGGVVSGHVCIGCGGTFEGRRRLYCTANCRRRTWEREKYRTMCGQCGADIDAHPRRSVRCVACYNAERHAEREARLALVAEAYNAGVPLREIALRFGRSVTSGTGTGAMGPELTELRKRGLIGYRYEAYERKAAA